MPTNNTKRRLALKALGGSALAGGVADQLPAIWQRPLVHSAALPAHAQASPAPLGNITLMLRDTAEGGSLSFNVRYEVVYNTATPREITHIYFGTQQQIAVHESRPGLLDAMFPAAHAQTDSTTAAPAARLMGSVELTQLTTLNFESNASRVQTANLHLSYNNATGEFPVTVELLRDRSAIYQIDATQSITFPGTTYMVEAPVDADGNYMEGSGLGVITEVQDRSLVRPQGVAEAQPPIIFRVADLTDQSQGVAEVDWFVFYHPITGQASGIGFGDITTEQEQMSGRFAQLFPAAHAQRGNPQQPQLEVEGSVQYLHFDGFAETSNMDTVGFVLNGQSARLPIQAMREMAPAMPDAATTPGISPRQAVSLRLMNQAPLTAEALDFGLFPQSGLNDSRGDPIIPRNRAFVNNWIADNALHTISFAQEAYSGTEGDQVTISLIRQGRRDITFNLVRAGTAGEEDAVINSVVPNISVTLPPGTQPVPMNPVIGPVTLSAVTDSYSFDVDLLRDANDAEGPETVTLRIEEPRVAQGRGRVRIGEIGQADVTITDTSVPQPSENRPWVGWAQTAYNFDEPLPGMTPSMNPFNDFGTRPGPAIARYEGESGVRVQFRFSSSNEPSTTASLTGENAIAVYFRVTDGAGVESGSDVRGYDAGDDYRLNATVDTDDGRLLSISGAPYTIDVDVLSDMAYEGYETVTLTLVPDPTNANAYVIDPNAARTLITLVNNPAPTTPVPGPTVAMTTPTPVERTFSWAWGSAAGPIEGSGEGAGNTYYAVGELTTLSVSVIQTEALATSHTYQVFENARLLYTVDLVANTVAGADGIILEMQDTSTASGHDFRFNANAAAPVVFDTNQPLNARKSEDYPVDFTVTPDSSAYIGLYYHDGTDPDNEDPAGWYLYGVDGKLRASSAETAPVIEEAVAPAPVIPDEAATTAGPTPTTRTISDRTIPAGERWFEYVTSVTSGGITYNVRGEFQFVVANLATAGTARGGDVKYHVVTITGGSEDLTIDVENSMLNGAALRGGAGASAANQFSLDLMTTPYVFSTQNTIRLRASVTEFIAASGQISGIEYFTSSSTYRILRRGAFADSIIVSTPTIVELVN